MSHCFDLQATIEVRQQSPLNDVSRRPVQSPSDLIIIIIIIIYSRGFRVGSEHIYKPDGHNSAKHNTKHNIIITFLQHNAYRALYYS